MSLRFMTLHDVVDKLMKKANPVGQVILGLSRYPVFLNHRTHRTHGNKSSHRYVIFPCLRWFLAWDRLPACPLLHDVGSVIQMVTVFFILKPDRLEAYPTSLSSVVLIYAPNCPALLYDKASRGAGQPANGTTTRVPAACGLLLAWQLTTNRTAELPAGYRGGFC